MYLEPEHLVVRPSADSISRAQEVWGLQRVVIREYRLVWRYCLVS